MLSLIVKAFQGQSCSSTGHYHFWSQSSQNDNHQKANYSKLKPVKHLGDFVSHSYHTWTEWKGNGNSTNAKRSLLPKQSELCSLRGKHESKVVLPLCGNLGHVSLSFPLWPGKGCSQNPEKREPMFLMRTAHQR